MRDAHNEDSHTQAEKVSGMGSVQENTEMGCHSHDVTMTVRSPYNNPIVRIPCTLHHQAESHHRVGALTYNQSRASTLRGNICRFQFL